MPLALVTDKAATPSELEAGGRCPPWVARRGCSGATVAVDEPASCDVDQPRYYVSSRIVPAQKKAPASEDAPCVWRANARREDL
jgi:hypothetical protein